MEKIFLRDDRLRKIIADRNKKIEIMLLTKKIRGSLSVRLATNGTHFGWEITDLETGQKIEERLGEKKGKIEPIGDPIFLRWV